jgi:divalent metal cation (Fe/Co/Zn/Cd) transporter
VQESRKTVYAALAANLAIAVAKLAGGLLSGSAAMLAEARTRWPIPATRSSC